MNDFDLDNTLKAAREPQLEADYAEDFPRRALAKLQATSLTSRTEHHWLPRLAWGGAIAFACLVIGFAFGHHWRGRIETAPSRELLENAKLIRETLAMFPNQVRAIVQDDHGIDLVLSANPDVPVSAPIYVHICDGKQCSSLVTFSGQEIQIAGQELTVLSDARGGIILEGNNFAWSSSQPAHAGKEMHIEARNLGSIAM